MGVPVLKSARSRALATMIGLPSEQHHDRPASSSTSMDFDLMRNFAMAFPLFHAVLGYFVNFVMRITRIDRDAGYRPTWYFWVGFLYSMGIASAMACAASIVLSTSLTLKLRKLYTWSHPARWLWGLLVFEESFGWFFHNISHLINFYGALQNSIVDIVFHVTLTILHVVGPLLFIFQLKRNYDVCPSMLRYPWCLLPLGIAAAVATFNLLFVRRIHPFKLDMSHALKLEYIEGLEQTTLDTANLLVGEIGPIIDSVLGGLAYGVLALLVEVCWIFGGCGRKISEPVRAAVNTRPAVDKLPFKMRWWVTATALAQMYPLLADWMHWRWHDSLIEDFVSAGIPYYATLIMADWLMHVPSIVCALIRTYYLSRLCLFDWNQSRGESEPVTASMSAGLKRFAFPGGVFPFIAIILNRYLEGVVIALLPAYLHKDTNASVFVVNMKQDGPKLALVMLVQYLGNMLGSIIFGRLMALIGFARSYIILIIGVAGSFAILIVPLEFSTFVVVRFLSSIFYPTAICVAYIAKRYQTVFPNATSSYSGLVVGLFWFNFGIALGSNAAPMREYNDNYFFWPCLMGLVGAMVTFVGFLCFWKDYDDKPKIEAPQQARSKSRVFAFLEANDFKTLRQPPVVLNNLAAMTNGLIISMLMTIAGPLYALEGNLHEFQFYWSVGAFSNVAASLLIFNCWRLPTVKPVVTMCFCASLHVLSTALLGIPQIYHISNQTALALTLLVPYAIGLFGVFTTNLACDQRAMELSNHLQVHIGYMMGLNKFCFALGQLLGPSIVFVCSTSFNSLHSSLWITAGWSAINLLTLTFCLKCGMMDFKDAHKEPRTVTVEMEVDAVDETANVIMEGSA